MAVYTIENRRIRVDRQRATHQTAAALEIIGETGRAARLRAMLRAADELAGALSEMAIAPANPLTDEWLLDCPKEVLDGLRETLDALRKHTAAYAAHRLAEAQMNGLIGLSLIQDDHEGGG